MVEHPKRPSENLSEKVNGRDVEDVVAQRNRKQLEDAQAAVLYWNAFEINVGSFADEHSTL
jgi:hypothetical protein